VQRLLKFWARARPSKPIGLPSDRMKPKEMPMFHLWQACHDVRAE